MIGIVFSCDRAMQLEALLQSFFHYCNDSEKIRIFVIYKVTNGLHEKQYNFLKQIFSTQENVSFILEDNFQQNVLTLLSSAICTHNKTKQKLHFSKLDYMYHLLLFLRQLFTQNKRNGSPFVLFLVDDNIFVRKFSLLEIESVLVSNSDAVGFSLRLGENTSYCYMANKIQHLPTFTTISSHIAKFRWVKSEGDFGYPLELSSSIYCVNDILSTLRQINFDNPNTLESGLARKASQYKRKKPCLLCYEESVAFCNPVNKVQSVAKNRSADKNIYSSESLAQMFESGYRINFKALGGFVPNSCHQEVDLSFEKSF